MSWLKNIVRPKIATRTKREVTADIWEKCPGCTQMIYKQELAENHNACPSCGYHLRWDVQARLNFLLDENSWQPIKVPDVATDPLKFRDTKRYSDRLKDARRKTGRKDAFMVGSGTVQGQPCVIAAMDFAFIGGSMGQAVGQAVVSAAQAAVKQQKPLLVISASGGARMQESILSLMQMARTTAAIQEVKEAGLPYIVLLTDPTTGGVTASFAMLGDVLLAEPGALIGFAGPQVIQQTIGETLPEGFQTAEYLLAHGMLDAIVPRADQPRCIANLLSMLCNRKPAPKGTTAA